MSSSNSNVVRQGETDNTLEHYTDTDPNRLVSPRENENGGATTAPPPPNRPSTGNRRSSTTGTGQPKQARFVEGTEGNPLRGMNTEDLNRPSDAAEMPNVGQAVEQKANPSMVPKRRGKVTVEDSFGAGNSGSGGMDRRDSSANGASGALSASGLLPSNSQPSGDFSSPLAMSKSVNLEARRKAGEERRKAHENAGTRNKQEPNMFASMMLGGGFNPNAQSGEFSPMSGQQQDTSQSLGLLGVGGADDSRSVARSQRSLGKGANGVGDVISALPQDDGPAMLVPATMEAPDQIFMPNMKREPYVPVRLARDKIKQALSEIASHNSKHYAAIETMEKQYDILKAQMEHQVATYAKKLTFHYNQRVADLNNQLKERLSSGAKGQAFAQLMNDVEKWKSRATDAEQELEVMRKELESVKEERDKARFQLASVASVTGAGGIGDASYTELPNASTATDVGMPRFMGGDRRPTRSNLDDV